MMLTLRMKAVTHESSPESALVYRKPSRRALTLDEIAGDRRRLALPHGAGVCRRDRLFGHALCACPPPEQCGARAGIRRARHPQSGAGCGLRLSRSFHPRVPRPFRRHARIGPRRNVPRSSQASGADHHGLNPARQSQGPAFRDRQGRCWSPASANATPTKTKAPPFPTSGSAFIRSVDNIPGQDRQGGLWRLLQRRRCRQFRLRRRRRGCRLLRPAARIPAACGFPSNATRCLPTRSTSRPSAAPSTRSGITGCRHRG